MTVDIDFEAKRKQSRRLAGIFFVLVGKPARYDNTVIADTWALEFQHCLSESGMTLDYVEKVLRWAFTDPFWSMRLHIAKNFKDNLQVVCDAYDGAARAQKLSAADSCVCPTIDGQRFHPDTGYLLPFDWLCPKHGEGGKHSVVGTYNISWVNRPGCITRKEWNEQQKRTTA